MKKGFLVLLMCLIAFAVPASAQAGGAFLDGKMVSEIQSGRYVYIYYTIGGYDHLLEIQNITPLGGRFLLEGWAQVVDTNAWVSFMGTYTPSEYDATFYVAAVGNHPWYEPSHSLLRFTTNSTYMEGRSTIDGLWYDGTWYW